MINSFQNDYNYRRGAMCFHGPAAIPIALVAAGSVLSAGMGVMQGMQQSKAAKANANAQAEAERYNAEIRRQNAETQQKIAHENANRETSRRTRLRSKQFANLAKMGLTDGSGDDFLHDQLKTDMLESSNIEFVGSLEAHNNLLQANLHDHGANSAIARGKAESSAAIFGGVTSAVGSIVGGAQQIASMGPTSNPYPKVGA